MRVPKSLLNLVEQGIIKEVVRPLMSGKEAQLYMVVSQDQVCAAKVYKDAQIRSFKHRADYMEGRKVRNTRDQRAMKNGSAYGRAKDEEAWRTTEVDTIYRLHAAGVRVPIPQIFIDGVLVMELVTDVDGHPAPRLGDVNFARDEAIEIYHHLLREVTRMLCAGVVHGDLSDFNVLLGAAGPVVIDFPQSVNAASNQNARALLLRDVANLHRFVERFTPGMPRRPYAEEIWALYESNKLTPHTELTGRYQRSSAKVNTASVLSLIDDANQEEVRRKQRAGEQSSAGYPARRRVIEVQPQKPARRTGQSDGAAGGRRRSGSGPHSGMESHRDGTTQRASSNRDAALPQRKPKKGPRRGNTVQACTYVSPAALKDNFSLTPRHTDEATSTAAEGDSSDGRTSKTGRRRRSRGGSKGGSRQQQGSSPEDVLRKTATPQTTAVTEGRNATLETKPGRRRRNRRSGRGARKAAGPPNPKASG